jgi:GNAT superfamily N-acetyltransferase
MKRIVPVNSPGELKSFIDFPHYLYKDDKSYVPELFIAQRDMLTPGKHPFYEHSEVKLFLAYDEAKIVGRIAAIYNANHNAYTERNDGFFGFFDTINDQETVDLLLNEVSVWLKEKGTDAIWGPVNLSTNDTCGLLIDGFDQPPVAMMPYNAPYYQKLLENSGLTKKTDLLAYEITTENVNDRSVRLIDALEARLKRGGIVIRSIDLKKFKEEVVKIREVYNSAWDKNLGFVPMTENEFNYLAKDLKMILDPDFCLVAEKDNKLVGFILGIPDINQILIKIKKGRLLPTGIFKLLFGKKNIKNLRVLTLGVVEEYRKLGIEGCLYGRVIKNGRAKGIVKAECSWMLEDNYMINHAIEQINGKVYKRYRLYEKAI